MFNYFVLLLNEKLVDFINKLRNIKWSSPWLDEIIISKSKWTVSSPQRPDHFFKEQDEIVHWNENEDIYIACFWTKEDIQVLADLLNMKDSLEINYSE